MLTTLRKSASGIMAKILMALLIIAFGVWGISASLFTGIGQNALLKVGDTEISGESFRIAYVRQLEALENRFGQTITPDQARAFGIDRMVLGSMATDAALNDQARKMGLGLSNGNLARIIAEDPAYTSVGGDRARFRQLLQQYRINEDEFVSDARTLALRRQLMQAVVGGMPAPTAMLELGHIYASETRSARYFVLDIAQLGDVEPEDEQVLKDYFEANKATFRAPETREIALFTLTPGQIAKPDAVTAEDVRAAYDDNLARFVTQKAGRSVSQLIFTDAAKAEEARALLASGASAQEIAANVDLGATLTELGSIDRAGLIDPTLSEAAFGLDAPGVTAVVTSRFGPALAVVTAITPEVVQPFEAVEASLRQELALHAAEGEVFDLHDAIEDARAGGGSLKEIAERFALELKTLPAVDRAGNDVDGKAVDMAEKALLLESAYDSDVGLENDPLPLAANGFLWFEVIAVSPEHDRSLEEVRDVALAAWRVEETRRRLDQLATEVVAEVKGGRTLEDIALERGLATAQASGFVRSDAPEGFGPKASTAAFDGPVGHIGSAETADGLGRVVFMVTDSTVPAMFEGSDDTMALRAQLEESAQNTLIEQYVAGLHQTLGLVFNEQLYGQLTGQAGR